jgi:hypothetical protein
VEEVEDAECELVSGFSAAAGSHGTSLFVGWLVGWLVTLADPTHPLVVIDAMNVENYRI